ncbi:HIT domain-containing protein [Streptomyces sp. NPDC046324]|uniref:HIT family protein n=1 Tax=Streptomyces sp. NPDC046324 TaxID=3154915 RepID=UPI003401CA31
MDSCVFCDIVTDPSRARVVFSDAHTLAFFPLTPATRGHTLVVPRTHFADLWAMDDMSAEHLTRTTLTVGRALRSVLEPEGMNVVNSAGRAASQSVFHCHTHLVPRWPGDAMGPIWPPRGGGFDDDELDVLVDRVSSAIGGTSP